MMGAGHRAHRRAADLRGDRSRRAGPPHPAADRPGHLRRWRVGRRGPHGRRARPGQEARPVRCGPADRCPAGAAARLRRHGAHGDDRPRRRVPRVGLAHPVPAERRAHPRRLLRAPEGRGEPGVRRAGRAPAGGADADPAALPQAHGPRHRRRARVRRQQRGRLHDDRRIHPELRHQRRRAARRSTAARCCGPSPAPPSRGCSRRSSPAGSPTAWGGATTYILGWALQLVGVFALFPLVNTGNIGLLFAGLALLTIGLGFTYGPQAALYSELFPASIRFSGVSISYAIGAILGGAFAPMIATAIVKATGGTAARDLRTSPG